MSCWRLLGVAVVSLVSLPLVSQQRLSRFDYEEVHFGNISVELCLYVRNAEEAGAAAKAAFDRVAVLSLMMSDYVFTPPSPLNRIAAEAPAAVKVPDELFQAIAQGVAMHKITNGAFDITAKPFVQLWRTSRRVGQLPPKMRLRNAQKYVDITSLKLDAEHSTVALRKQGMWLDLGGLAKGLIGDEVIRILRDRGVRICRYSAGGDMVFGDPPPNQKGWTVTVPDLHVDSVDGGKEPLTFLIENGAASVSGDVFRYVDIDGVRYAHVVDPRTGLGVSDQRVTCVRGRRGADTDPLATAGLILNRKQWLSALSVVEGCKGDSAKIQR